MNELPKHTSEMWATLQQVAVDTLERKRLLGQYAVVWQNGKPVIIGEESERSLPAKPGYPAHA